MRIDRNTNTSSLARSFHSAQGLPVRARRQGQDRQELPSVLNLFHFRVFLRVPASLRETQAFFSRPLATLSSRPAYTCPHRRQGRERRGVQLNITIVPVSVSATLCPVCSFHSDGPSARGMLFLSPVRFTQLKPCLYVPAGRAEIAKNCLLFLFFSILGFPPRPCASAREFFSHSAFGIC